MGSLSPFTDPGRLDIASVGWGSPLVSDILAPESSPGVRSGGEMAPMWLPFRVPCITAVLHLSWQIHAGQGEVATASCRVATRHKLLMPNSFRHSQATDRVWALAWLAFLASGPSCGSDRSAGPSENSAAGDSLVPPDSALAPIDSLAPDSIPRSDSVPIIPADSVPTIPTDSIPSAPTQSGIPFGPFSLWESDTTVASGPEPFTMSNNADRPEGIVLRINAARRMGQKLILCITGGSHSRYITRDKFDMAKWKARQDRFDTPAIKAAVAAAVQDGTVLMSNIMDEPNHRSWGGVMTKPLLDEMAAYVKRIFPMLPVGVAIRWDWRPDERYKVVDFIVTQYVSRFGSVTTWRDQALAAARQNGIAVVFSFNPLNGGTPIRDCPLGETGGEGTYGGNCRMTAAQVRAYGSTLGVAACALLMWRYDAAFMSKPDNHQAFKDVAAKLSTSRGPSCRRH
jgi:hypothetical protein